MQAHGAARGVVTTPRRNRRLEVLLAIVAIVVIAAVMALLARGFFPAANAVGVEDANLGAGSTIVHDDAGNLKPR